MRVAAIVVVGGVCLVATPTALAGATPFSSAAGTCTAPGTVQFATAGAPADHPDVSVRFTTSGGAGSVSLDDGSTAGFGAGDIVWLSYGYAFTAADDATASGTISCPSSRVAFTVDLLGAPTLGSTFTGSSSVCGLKDFDVSGSSLCSDLVFDAQGATVYYADVRLSSGAVMLSLPYQAGAITQKFRQSGTMPIGVLVPVRWNLLVTRLGNAQARWTVVLRAVQLPKGGSGKITTGGQVGQLAIDSSKRIDVLAFAGRPDAEAVGTFYVPGDSKFDALGYSCQSHRSGTVAPVRYYSGPFCRTVFYISNRTGRLAAFYTSSARWVGPAGISPGMPASHAETRTHKRATRGCHSGFQLGNNRSAALLLVDVSGGYVVSQPAPHASTIFKIVGGKLSGFELESTHHRVGLQFC